MDCFLLVAPNKPPHADHRAEGDALSRKAGDLETTVRKLRSSLRDVEAERDKLTARVKALESQLLDVQERADKYSHDSVAQVCHLLNSKVAWSLVTLSLLDRILV